MLRIIFIILVSYIVFRIALRLLLTESPAQKRTRIYSENGRYQRAGRNERNPQGRFDHIEDAEFEEVPNDASKEKHH